MFLRISFLALLSIVTMGKCDLSEFFKVDKNNLTAITWEHAVNNQTLLKNALKCDVNMLEADVQFGTLINTSKPIPIMAHSLNDVADLSLEQFLANVSQFNTKNEGKRKGVKLDFKSFEAFNESIPILEKLDKIDFPLWLNADILVGPGNSTFTPVDPNKFLERSVNFKNSTLSIGWTTGYNNTINEIYTSDQIQSIISNIKTFSINQEITFPVRAVYAANSLENLSNLLKNITKSTLTIWSAKNDNVNVSNLREMIFKIGLDKIYIDVPKSLMDQLDLGNSAFSAKSFGIITMILSVARLLDNVF